MPNRLGPNRLGPPSSSVWQIAHWRTNAALPLPASPAARNAQSPQATAAVEIDAHAIGGTVTSRFGAEAGVWVIAETRDLGTRFAKMVVTDDRGRYVLPDLPAASYQVWVRGYGLVDSP